MRLEREALTTEWHKDDVYMIRNMKPETPQLTQTSEFLCSTHSPVGLRTPVWTPVRVFQRRICASSWTDEWFPAESNTRWRLLKLTFDIRTDNNTLSDTERTSSQIKYQLKLFWSVLMNDIWTHQLHSVSDSKAEQEAKCEPHWHPVVSQCITSTSAQLDPAGELL